MHWKSGNRDVYLRKVGGEWRIDIYATVRWRTKVRVEHRFKSLTTRAWRDLIRRTNG